MARIVLTTFGSTGDLNPFIAAGLGLRARGHDVLFAVEDAFCPTVREVGFEVSHLTGDAATALAPYAKQLFGGSNPLVSVKTLLDHYILPTLPDKVKELRAACEGADLLVSCAFHIAGAIVADLTNIPWASLALSPIVLPSAYIETQPPPFALPPTLQRLNTRLTWNLGALIFRRVADTPINRIRAAYGLPPRQRQLWFGGLSPRLICLACSPAFQPPAPGWPHIVHTTGFAFWDTPTSWHPTPELQTFLDGDTPIVAVTAGSIAPDIAGSFATFYRTSISAIRATGARALIIGATPEHLTSPHESDVLALPFAPYSQVFPRCAAIIHHGGIGTTAQCLRYGIPSLVVPWGVDQFYTGGRLSHLDAGAMLLSRRYTVERATHALRALLEEPRYHQSTQSLAAHLSKEDGVSSLCDAVETLLPPKHLYT